MEVSSLVGRRSVFCVSRRLLCAGQVRLAGRFQSTSSTSSPPPLTVLGRDYLRDSQSNTPQSILAKVGQNLHLRPSHPLSNLRQLIESHFPNFTHHSALSPVVTVKQNFDDLGFPKDHPGRRKTDSYYLNEEWMLRTHTSAHEVEFFSRGEESFLITADVYRRDEIDRSHYPVFHQVEGCYTVHVSELERLAKENEEMRLAFAKNEAIEIVDETSIDSTSNMYQSNRHSREQALVLSEHLKNTLNGLVFKLFSSHVSSSSSESEKLKVRWIEATFPWTAPSYEVEVFFQGKWLEILGCGVIRQDALDRSGVPETRLGWAFGLGLERIAMVLHSIPDIRLFWSEDPRFSSQFESGETTTVFKPYSKYPECYKDLSFWIPDSTSNAEREDWHENDFMECVRDKAGDLVERVELIDEFIHPKTGRRSVCYRLNYRSMDRSLSNDEVNVLQDKVVKEVVDRLGVEIR